MTVYLHGPHHFYTSHIKMIHMVWRREQGKKEYPQWHSKKILACWRVHSWCPEDKVLDSEGYLCHQHPASKYITRKICLTICTKITSYKQIYYWGDIINYLHQDKCIWEVTYRWTCIPPLLCGHISNVFNLQVLHIGRLGWYRNHSQRRMNKQFLNYW